MAHTEMEIVSDQERFPTWMNCLAAVSKLVAFEVFVFAGFAKQNDNRNYDLNGNNNQPSAHAFHKAGWLPFAKARK